MYYQIKPNDSTRTPGQHIALQVISQSAQSAVDTRIMRKTFNGVAGKRWRMVGDKVTREQSIYYEELADFWEWFYAQLNPKIGTWVWCDNLTLHLWLLAATKEMDQRRMVYERSVLSPKVSFLRASTERGSVLWLDRCNWWRCSVDVLIYGSLSAVFSGINKVPTENCQGGKPRLIVDTIFASVTSLCQFIRRNDLGCLRVTAAGQSLAAYRHRLGPRRSFTRRLKIGKRAGQVVRESRLWPRRHDNTDALHLERSSYFGGPTHCYYIGKVEEPVYVLDVRSIYPFVMKTNQFPCELVEVQNGVNIESVRERLGRECGVARVRIKSTNNVYPIRREWGVLYARGRFESALAGPELAKAIRQNDVESVYQVSWYAPQDLFSKFVDYFYGERKRYELENKPAWADLCKLILNSLGSKFGQLTGEWRDDSDMIAEQPWGYWHHVDLYAHRVDLCRSISGRSQVLNHRTESAHSFPAIPSYMCSYARVYMDDLIGIGKSFGKVWYSAVDSIHCDKLARDALDHAGRIGNELGQLRLKTVAECAEYRGVGDYALNGTVTRSGLPNNAVPSCGYCRAWIVDGKCNCPSCNKQWDGATFSWPEQESAAEAIGRGSSPEIIERTVTKSLPSTYKFGRVKPDGWVESWTLPCGSLSDGSAEIGE